MDVRDNIYIALNISHLHNFCTFKVYQTHTELDFSHPLKYILEHLFDKYFPESNTQDGHEDFQQLLGGN